MKQKITFLTLIMFSLIFSNVSFSQEKNELILRDGLKTPIMNESQVLQKISEGYSNIDLTEKLNAMNDWKVLLDEVHTVNKLISAQAIDATVKQSLNVYKVSLKLKTSSLIDKAIDEKSYHFSEDEIIHAAKNNLLVQ